MSESPNSLQSEIYGRGQQNKKGKHVTTRVMVEDALITIHNAKGVTIKHIHNYILNNYGLESLSTVRVSLIRKHILSLRESEDITNTTGAGLRGRFKLIDKRKFIKKTKRNNKQVKNNLNNHKKEKTVAAKTLSKNPRKTSKRKRVVVYSKDIARKILITKEMMSTIPMQVTPLELRKKKVPK